MKWDSIEASGKGTVHSYTVMHHPAVPGYGFPIPIGLIDLEEGTRIVANLKGCEADDVFIGMNVECLIEPASEDDDLMLPFFYKV